MSARKDHGYQAAIKARKPDGYLPLDSPSRRTIIAHGDHVWAMLVAPFPATAQYEGAIVGVLNALRIGVDYACTDEPERVGSTTDVSPTIFGRALTGDEVARLWAAGLDAEAKS